MQATNLSSIYLFIYLLQSNGNLEIEIALKQNQLVLHFINLLTNPSSIFDMKLAAQLI